jgi:hypothetical protein
MRRLAFCVLVLALAAPASAQIAGRHDYGDVRMPERLGHDGGLPRAHPSREARDIRGDIRNLRESGAISRREARRLTREARAIGRIGGSSLSAGSARAVDAQILALRAQVASAPARAPGRGRRR